MPKQGKYIVIEGQDGTGKTTQADLLQKHLEGIGHRVIHIKEPGGSPIAEAIREVILNGLLPRTPMTNILLFTANRHELWHSVIVPSLTDGVWVICTRNYWSTLAFQGYGEGMDADVITAITHTFTDSSYMQPDYAVILSHDNHGDRNKRIASRGEVKNPDPFESRQQDFHDRVHAGYLEVAKQYNIPIINASASIDEIQQQIREIIQQP